MQRSDFAHWLTVPVRWGDMDTLGHVNNAVFFTYVESGRIDYFNSLLGPDRSLWGVSGPILASISCDFRAQVKFPADLDVGTRVSRIGNSSYTLLTGIFVAGSDAPAAEATATAVWFDYTAQKPVPVPDHVRAAITGREPVAPEGA